MKTVKQRKLLLVLPLLVIPFLTMAFWALGGGRGKKEVDVTDKGLNLDLPDANLKADKLVDKLGFYEQADKDSLKMEEWMRSDPYFRKDTVPAGLFPNELEELTMSTDSKFSQQLNPSPYERRGNNTEEQIMAKLKMLEEEMNRPVATRGADLPADDAFSREVNQLQEMMQQNSGGGAEDQEMRQLESTLDKILDIQHPSRVKERSVQHKEAAYAVRKERGVDTLVKGFYSFSDEKEMADQNAVEAIIASNQTIVNGAVVKFRTITDMYVNGSLVPANTIVAGIAALDGERLMVEIHSIRSGKNLYGVKLSVYDMDGLPGIYIPGTINREVAKESLNNSLSLADMTTLDPSFKAQAAATGISAVKNLISKKSKLVRVQVKAGYKVLFKNKN